MTFLINGAGQLAIHMKTLTPGLHLILHTKINSRSTDMIKHLKDNIGEYLELEACKDVLNKTQRSWDDDAPQIKLLI